RSAGGARRRRSRGPSPARRCRGLRPPRCAASAPRRPPACRAAPFGQVYEDVGEFFHALKVFGDQLADVGWFAVAIALALQLAKMVVRSIAWRNILQASYPETRVPQRPVLGAYLAGVGVNSIIPGRAGDVVKIYLVHRSVEGTAYTTLASTLVTETLLDFVLAGAILLWALTQGVLPSLHVLPSIHSFDWTWVLARSSTGAAVFAGL